MKKIFFTGLLFVLSLSANTQTLERKIDSLIMRSDYTTALKLIGSEKNKSNLLLNKEAEILMTLGKLDNADSVLSKIDFNNDFFVKSISQNNQGYLQLLKGRSDLAQNYFEQARDGFRQIGKDNTKEAAQCYSNLSVLYWSIGKYNQAEENALLALQLRQTIFGNESEETAASLNDLGLVYGSTDADKALDYYEKAKAVYEKMYNTDHPKIAVANTNIGLMYFNLKLYGDAINNFESALSIWRKKYPEGHSNEALVLVNLGRAYQQLKNDKAAIEYYEKALVLYKKNYGNKHPDIAVVYNQIASIHIADNQFAVALTDLQNSLCANVPTFNELSFLKNPSIESFYNGKVLLYSLRLKAQALEAKYYGQSLKLKELKLALSTLQLCDSLIDNIRHNSLNENDKIELGAIAHEAYEDGVRIATAISEMTLQQKKYREIAFYFAEKSKSAVLQESIAEAQAKSFAGIPEEILEEEKSKKSEITFLAHQLSEKPNAEEEKKLRSTLFNANLNYQKWIKKLEQDYPAYFNLKFSSISASASDVEKSILPQQAVVSYFIDKKSKRLYQFVITSKKLKIKTNELPGNFERSIKGFINSLLYSNFSAYQNAQLIAGLLKPQVPSSVKKITLIPSGILSSIPFEALSYKKIKGKDFNDVSFFVDQWSISYEFAAGLMLQKGKDKNNASNNIFLVAPVHFNENFNLNDLPGTEQEVKNISNLFQAQSKVALLASATESLLKTKEIGNYKYLHLATHGIVDVKDPANSEIFLNSTASDDGNLFSSEIYNLDLNADLAVLSACETGLGKFSEGEGVIGLSRALTYAGAKNIIVSFWKVSDESTSELMVDFYKHLLSNKNENFSEALRQAKIEIKKGNFSSPYYWAPFVLIGK